MSEEKHKFSVIFDDEAMNIINELKNQKNCQTGDVIRDAMGVYYWLFQQVKNGYGFGLIKDGTITPIEIKELG